MGRLIRIAGALVALAITLGATSGDVNWPTYGGDGENHYSPLDQINVATIGRLGLAWHYDIDTPGSSFTAPIAVDGVIYMAAGHSVVHAIDAVSGKLLWAYDPKVAEVAGVRLRAAWGSRGIAYARGRVFVATLDGRLIALDAKTGTLAWSVVTVEPDDGRYITGAPWVFDDKVVIGHGGADFVPIRGYVTAYDQATGKQAWRFHTVPGNPAKGFENEAMAMAAKTWTGEWWKYGGGGTVWNAMAYDPKYHRIYIGTGNGTPWNQKIRSPDGGDNLFLCSIIALDADTGEYVWHYQVNPGEVWDYNAAMDIELAEVDIGGQKRDVLMQAPKNGFFYVIDRATGKLISAEPIVPLNWASAIDPKTGRPIENAEARYPDGKAAIVYPSMYGAHNVDAMSYSPHTRLAYIPIIDRGAVYVDPPRPFDKWTFLDRERFNGGVGAPPPGLNPRTPASALLAWNPATQKQAWRIPLQGGRDGGGTMVTAGGLLFQGRSTGQFVAMAADSGRQLWSFAAQTAVAAQPISYSVGGRQYVTVIAGARYPDAIGLPREWDYRTQQWRLLTFALDGRDRLPAATRHPEPYRTDPTFRIDPAKAARGAMVFGQRCIICHGMNAMSGGAAPHLLRSQLPLDLDAFTAIVRDGALRANGMPDFPELGREDVEGLQHYIRLRAREADALEGPGKGHH